MSQNLTGSATIQGSKAVINSLNYKKENISESIQPEMVKRTTLHPVYNDNDEVEERIYYTLHNDAATCTYVSPHMKFEKSNNIIISTVPGKPAEPGEGNTDNDIPIIPMPPTPPPVIGVPPTDVIWPDEEEEEEDEEDGGGTGGGGGGGSSGGGDGNGTSSSAPRKNFDNYAAEIAGPLGKNNINSTRDVVRWYQNRSAMESARFAMAKTRSRYNSRGCYLSETYAKLIDAHDMYFNSYIETGRFGIPKVVQAPRMFKDAIYLEELTLRQAKSLINAESMCENCYNLEHFTLSDNHQLSNATAMFKNCIGLKDVKFHATNSLTTMDHMFEGCKSPTMTPFSFPVVETAKYALSKTTYKNVDLKFPELRDASYMLYDCKNLTTVQPTSNLQKLQKGEGMFKGCIALQNDNTPIYANLTQALEMYNGCTALSTIAGRYPALQNGKEMFKKCAALKDVDIEFKFPVLVEGTSMFEKCRSLNNLAFTLPYLQNGDKMFKGCSGVFLININAPNLQSAESMLEGTMPMESLTFNAINATNLNRAFYGTGSTSYASSEGYPASWNTSFDANLTINPVTAREMFKDSCIVNFNNSGTWTRLTDATSMFENCLFLNNINFGEAPALTTIDGMFKDCAALTTVTANFPSVVSCEVGAFSNCPRLKNVSLSINNLISAENMFRNCGELESMTGSFNNLSFAKYMFSGCTSLKSGPSTPEVTDAFGMYQNSGITTVPSMPNIMTGRQTFMNCRGITGHVSASYDHLENGINMFNGCSGITSVSISVPAGADIRNMFAICSNITSVTSVSFGSGVNATSLLSHAKVDKGSFMKVYNAIKSANAIADHNGCVCHVGVDSGVIGELESDYEGVVDSEGNPLFYNWEGNQYALRLSTDSDNFVMAVSN